MSQVDETTEIIKRAVHDIQPGQKDTVMVACLMRIYDAVMNQREHNPSWQLSTGCLLYTSPSPRDRQKSRMPSSA